MPHPPPDPVGPGQESVWDYPRPAVIEPTGRSLRVLLAGTVVAETARGMRALETSHPPVYFFPPDDVHPRVVRQSRAPKTMCEWKGQARYVDLVVPLPNGGQPDGPGGAPPILLERVGFAYDRPTPPFRPITGWLSFYARPILDAGRSPEALHAGPTAITVDGETVTPQPGDFYSGWITRDVAGPFKGGPGTMGW